MPSINIKEFNRTSAGTPGRYGNYSVLITGYMGNPNPSKGDVIDPDTNGVYEFNSQGDFLATIGESAVNKKDLSGKVVELHYGNRMAMHLLGIGYPIIYKVIDSVQDMNSELFWADFKDKASYDFRFISHGLLETCYDVGEHTKFYNELTALKADADRFAKIITDVEKKNADEDAKKDEDPSYTVIEYTEKQEYYRVIAEKGQEFAGELDDEGYYKGEGEGYTGFRDSAGVPYSYDAAVVEFAVVEGGTTAKAVKDKQDAFDLHNSQHLSPETFRGINQQIAQLASYIVDETTGEPYTNANGRGDCTALIELDEDEYCEKTTSEKPEILIRNGIVAMSQAIGDNGKYCAMTVPSVYYANDLKMPGAFHYLACFMNSMRSGFAEWYAAAGYTRGISSYAIDHTSVKLGEMAINTLEPRTKDVDGQFACNVIANFRGSYYLWGNRTAAPLDDKGLTADHFLNIRQLCSTLKKQLYVACRRFTFDPNSDALWFNFVNAIAPTLDAMKANQGVRDYKILKEYTDKKATLKAKIRIIPIEAVEDFDLEVSLEDSFGETSAVVNE